MAALTTQTATPEGTTLTMSAASGGGDTFVPGSSTCLLVRNGDASSKTVTVVVPGTKYGQANPDIPVVVAAGAIAILGPYSSDLVDPTDGQVDVTYSATTSVTVAAVKFV
jgi:hypothetical protein